MSSLKDSLTNFVARLYRFDPCLPTAPRWRASFLLFAGHFIPLLIFGAWLGPHTHERGVWGPIDALINWDAEHYEDIASRGYVVQKPLEQLTSDDIHAHLANPIFFPGWPYLIRALHLTTGAPVRAVMLALTLLLGILFWRLVLAGIDRYGRRGHEQSVLTLSERRIVIGNLLFYPSTFFIALPYTEALFLCALLGFLIAIEAMGQRHALRTTALAIAAGITLTATRIFGAPLVFVPLIAQTVDALRTKKIDALKLLRFTLIGTLSLIGIGSFFAYCQMTFGYWDLYERIQIIGWGSHRDYLAIFKPLTYLPRFFFEPTTQSLSHAAVPAFLIYFVLLLRREQGILGIRNSLTQLPTQRLTLYAMAFLLWYVPVVAKVNHKMDSVIRYVLPAHLMLVMAHAHQMASVSADSAGKHQPRLPFRTIGNVLLALLQLWMMQRYIRGKWIA